MSSTSKTAVFLLAGMAAGVTLGILLAPAKGKVLTGTLISIFRPNPDLYARQYDAIENAII